MCPNTYTYPLTPPYIYIYIYREREREIEIESKYITQLDRMSSKIGCHQLSAK